MKTYAKLRGIMREHDDTMYDLGNLLLLSNRAISARMNNRAEWKLGEMYAIMNRYHLPHSMLNEVFPMNGKKIG